MRDAHQRAVDTARTLPPETGERMRGERDRGRDGAPSKDAPPAAIDPDLQGDVVRDVVADARGTLDDTLEENFVGNVVDNLTGGLLTINFVDGSGGSGPDRVVLTTDAGGTWTFQESELDDVLTGDDSLPANLVQVLNQQGITDVVLVNQLLRLF